MGPAQAQASERGQEPLAQPVNGWTTTSVMTKGAIPLADCGKPPTPRVKRWRECCAMAVVQDWKRSYPEYEVNLPSVRIVEINDLDLGLRTQTLFEARRTR